MENLGASGDIRASDASEDDVKPRIHTKPSRRKTKWSSNLGQKQFKPGIGMLQDQEKAEPFSCLKLPESINWLKPELKKGKAFEDAELRANAAGMCGLAALTCAESSRAHPSRIHSSCKRSWTCCVPGGMTSAKIASDVGAKLYTGIFNKETEAIRQQLARSAKLAPARTILLNSSPSQTLLLKDDKKIAKAMEAAQATVLRSQTHL
jgi:hypothetical protein